jgi:hypothetical protein
MLIRALSELNFLAVFVAGLAHMVANLIWFSPLLFGKAWSELTGKESKPAIRWIPAGILGHQAIALALAVIVILAQATTVAGGIAVAVLVWAGFVVTLEIGELIWEKIPFKLFVLRISGQLVANCICGAMLAVWR